ncbi:hypothetical protein B0H19DRAFT_1324255 [Mycena capillaripes]|nr:hypothetical protein B0H19DRAFT_1324255 [Mycena capillaripes]
MDRRLSLETSRYIALEPPRSDIRQWEPHHTRTSQKDNVFHEILSHLTGCSAAPNAAEMGGRRERLPCCVARNVRFWRFNGNILLAGCNSAELRSRAPSQAQKIKDFAWGGNITMSTSSRATSSRSTRSECAERMHWAVGKVCLHQAHRMPSGLKKITRGRVTIRTPSKVASSRSARSKRVGEGARDSGEEWAHHDENVVEGNVPAFHANNVRGRVHGTAGKVHEQCKKQTECRVGPKKEGLTPGTLIIVLLLIFLYTRFLGIGSKGRRWFKFRRECSGTGWESGHGLSR